MAVIVTGIKEVDAMLRRLSDKDVRRVTKQALRIAAYPVRDAAKRIIPLGTGTANKKGNTVHLRDNLAVRAGRGRGARLSVVVTQKGGSFSGDTYYGSFVELGHKTGKRQAKQRGKGSRREIAGKWYMKQAGDATEQQATDIYEKVLFDWATREAGK